MRRPEHLWAVTVPEGRCPGCGADDWEPSVVPFRKRLVAWFNQGGRGRGSGRRCRSCGLTEAFGSWSALYRLEPGGIRWMLGAPIRLVWVLLARRNATPVPRTYLLAAVVGVALGVFLDLLLGWPWWGVALAFLAAVWLLFLSTAFWGTGRGGPGHDLGTELLRAVSPPRAEVRRRRLQDAMWRRAPFPLYGLPPSWPGMRSTGGWSASGDRVTRLSLLHGDPRDPEGSSLEVSVGEPAPSEDEERRQAASDLWDGMDPGDASWERIVLALAGRDVAFDHLAEGVSWIALARMGDVAVVVRGRRFPVGEVVLVPVDAEPYLAGTDAMRGEGAPPP